MKEWFRRLRKQSRALLSNLGIGRGRAGGSGHGKQVDISGKQMQVLPLDEDLHEATRDAATRVLALKSSVKQAFFFKARFKGGDPILFLGLVFDDGSSRALEDGVVTDVSERLGPWSPKPIALISLWADVVPMVAENGFKVYDRKLDAPRGHVTIPEGFKVVVAEPFAVPSIVNLESGVRIVDLGPHTIDNPKFFETVREYLASEPAAPIMWVFQGSAVSSFPLDPKPLQDWLRTLYRLIRLRPLEGEAHGHVFIVKAADRQQKVFAYLLLALGTPLYKMEPAAGFLVEIHRPEGVMIGMTALQGKPLEAEACFVLHANEEKDRLADSATDLTEVEHRERASIAQVLEAVPQLQWARGDT